MMYILIKHIVHYKPAIPAIPLIIFMDKFIKLHTKTNIRTLQNKSIEFWEYM